ncbi:G-patch domain [Mycena kentingensis (nom. inval.)]|nr:G-patch domain [Mycena kentingensis (nom. inval.)]
MRTKTGKIAQDGNTQNQALPDRSCYPIRRGPVGPCWAWLGATMTSRLKKRLDNLGVDTHSQRANENFCLIGTPLPPLEKSKDTGEFVRDEKGRRRLHGAFTGGFSAGYFNTVGSKEGWTPSTFVSSRNDRSKKKAARPEDFMDEEDLQDLRESRNIVDTTEEMDLTAGTQRGPGDDEEQDSMARTLEAAMLPTAQDSAGARILKKMGWRIGQGIGPRVTLRQRKLQDLIASGRRFAEAAIVVPDDEEAKKHTYAPRDIATLVVERKDNTHGIGYRPGMSLNEGSGNASATASGPKISSGFGLGALNDADEDDLDVYDSGTRLQNRNRTAYDIIDREEDEKISIGTRAERSSSRTQPGAPTHTFRDGRPVLAGFVLSDQPVSENRHFSLPEVPPGWKPDPRRVWGQGIVPQQEPEAHMQPQGQGRNKFSADQRGTLLGETPLPSAPRSVFEYMSQKDRERIQNIASGATSLPPSGITQTSAPAPVAIAIPRTEPHIALQALNGGFIPFATDPAKQARYTQYLESQTTADSAPAPPRPLPGQPIDEYNKELEDYAKAAVIFKPLTGAMAGRFTSAVVVEHGPQITEGLYQPTAEDFEKKEEELRKEREEKVSRKVHAARHGMYGPMTRETQSWQPARLLCKRFRVKDPQPVAEDEEPASSGFGFASAAAASESGGGGGAWDQFSAAAGVASTSGAVAAGSNGIVTGGPRDLANIGLGEDDSQGRDTLTYQRPAMDVFKAIFASDDEDSDDEGDKPAADDPPEDVPAIVPQTVASTTSIPSESTPVDPATFKPTFIPREGKAKDDSDRAKDKKEKRKKEKKDRKSLVSFIEDDGGDGGLQIVPKDKDRPKKKRKKDKEKRDAVEEDESMWVEKPAPEVVKSIDVAMPPPPVPDEMDEVVSRGRKRAIDFM